MIFKELNCRLLYVISFLEYGLSKLFLKGLVSLFPRTDAFQTSLNKLNKGFKKNIKYYITPTIGIINPYLLSTLAILGNILFYKNLTMLITYQLVSFIIIIVFFGIDQEYIKEAFMRYNKSSYCDNILYCGLSMIILSLILITFLVTI